MRQLINNEIQAGLVLCVGYVPEKVMQIENNITI
jgi:hypothetical protein